MVLAHIEREPGSRRSQKDLSRARFLGEHPSTPSGPGVYARANSVAVPAIPLMVTSSSHGSGPVRRAGSAGRVGHEGDGGRTGPLGVGGAGKNPFGLLSSR